MNSWYNLTKQIRILYIAVCTKFHIIGEDNIAPCPKAIVANHTKLIDSFILPFPSLPRRWCISCFNWK
jgi:1-acyl-sn-glycerol-3-phosphate acyltransferase